jgi:hypothetical protein
MKFMKLLRSTALWILLLPGVLFFTGAASNQAVLIANNGKFPVQCNEATYNHILFVKKVRVFKATVKEAKAEKKGKEEDVIEASIEQAAAEQELEMFEKYGIMDDAHTVMTSKTHLNFLADEFDLQDAVYSIGDGLLSLGEYLWEYAFLVWGLVVFNKLRALSTQQ